MNDAIGRCAAERFGLSYLFPYQRLVITNILAAIGASPRTAHTDDRHTLGRQIVILPTGAGKSLCFQLPAALVDGITVVVYPLLSLMNDQARRIAAAGFTVVQLKGGQSQAERTAAVEAITDDKCDFVLTNPETLCGAAVRRLLGGASVAHVVVDEAHCISEWGDTFREAYLTLGESLAAIDAPVVTAFTATATDRALQRIRQVLFASRDGEGAHLVRGNPDRENITYSVVPCLNKKHALRKLAAGARPAPEMAAPAEPADDGFLPVWSPGDLLPLPAIVFCRTRAETESVARSIGKEIGSDRALYYHAGLPREEKARVEERFFTADDAILAATCAYGMGVDKSDIRAVIHTYIPETVEAFLQESGRGGRDREPAFSIVLVDPADGARYRRRRGGRTGDQLQDVGHVEAAGSVQDAGRIEADSPVDEAGPVEDALFGTGCRRRALLRRLGADGDTCSGCDRCCDPDRPALSRATELILRTIAVVPHRFTPSEWIALWRRRLSDTARLAGHRGLPGWGALERWSQTELEEALETLVAADLLKLRRNRVYLSSPRRRKQVSTGHRLPSLSSGRGAD